MTFRPCRRLISIISLAEGAAADPEVGLHALEGGTAEEAHGAANIR